MDVTEVRGLGDAADDPPEPVTVQGPAVEFDEMLVAGGPRGEELDEGGMQGDVAVIAQP